MTDDPLAGQRILLVEDEMLISMLLEDMLTDCGCTVVGPAARIPEAIGLIEAELPDAAVLDVNLAGERSYPIADMLIARGVPFLFLTGYHGLEASYDSLPRLQKPCNKTILRAALCGLFGL